MHIERELFLMMNVPPEQMSRLFYVHQLSFLHQANILKNIKYLSRGEANIFQFESKDHVEHLKRLAIAESA